MTRRTFAVACVLTFTTVLGRAQHMRGAQKANAPVSQQDGHTESSTMEISPSRTSQEAEMILGPANGKEGGQWEVAMVKTADIGSRGTRMLEQNEQSSGSRNGAQRAPATPTGGRLVGNPANVVWGPPSGGNWSPYNLPGDKAEGTISPSAAEAGSIFHHDLGFGGPPVRGTWRPNNMNEWMLAVKQAAERPGDEAEANAHMGQANNHFWGTPSTGRWDPY